MKLREIIKPEMLDPYVSYINYLRFLKVLESKGINISKATIPPLSEFIRDSAMVGRLIGNRVRDVFAQLLPGKTIGIKKMTSRLVWAIYPQVVNTLTYDQFDRIQQSQDIPNLEREWGFDRYGDRFVFCQSGSLAYDSFDPNIIEHMVRYVEFVKKLQETVKRLLVISPEEMAKKVKEEEEKRLAEEKLRLENEKKRAATASMTSSRLQDQYEQIKARRRQA